MSFPKEDILEITVNLMELTQTGALSWVRRYESPNDLEPLDTPDEEPINSIYIAELRHKFIKIYKRKYILKKSHAVKFSDYLSAEKKGNEYWTYKVVAEIHHKENKKTVTITDINALNDLYDVIDSQLEKENVK